MEFNFPTSTPSPNEETDINIATELTRIASKNIQDGSEFPSPLSLICKLFTSVLPFSRLIHLAWTKCDILVLWYTSKSVSTVQFSGAVSWHTVFCSLCMIHVVSLSDISDIIAQINSHYSLFSLKYALWEITQTWWLFLYVICMQFKSNQLFSYQDGFCSNFEQWVQKLCSKNRLIAQ